MAQIITPAGADLSSISKQAPRVASLPSFYEDWADDFVDQSKWGYTVTGTGEVNVNISGTGLAGSLSTYAGLLVGTAAADTASIWTRKLFPVPHGQTALTTIVEVLNVEWEARTQGLASIDNTQQFMGLAQTQAALRTTNNLIGFYYASDVLGVLVDEAGTETTSALASAPTANATHKYGIKIDRSNGVRFYVGDVLQATIAASDANIPNIQGVYFNVFAKNDVASADWLRVGHVRIWMEDLI